MTEIGTGIIIVGEYMTIFTLKRELLWLKDSRVE
jgi:hypothetical protein